MKSLTILSCTAVMLLIQSCGGSKTKKENDKTNELAKLKTEQATLNTKIADLELQLKTKDSSNLENAILVSAEPLVAKTFTTYIDVQGKIDAENNVNASVQMPGSVKKILVGVGQHVKQGQTLAILDDAVLRQGIDEINTQIKFADNIYQKQNNLWQQNIGTEVQLLSAKNNVQALKDKLETLKAQLNMYLLKSPISGVVDEVFIKVGQSAAPGLPTIRVINTNILKVKAQVSESYAGNVRIGSPVVVNFPDINVSINSRVSYVSAVVDPLNRGFNVEIKLPPANNIRPNMLAALKIISKQENNRIVIPVKTIIHAPDGDFVFVANDGKAQRRKITTAETYDGKIMVLTGLVQNDLLITDGFENLEDGDTVTFAN